MSRLLANQSQEDQERLRPYLEPVTLEYRRTLYDAYCPIPFVYFLIDGVASLVLTLENGDALEVGTVGNEGIVGLPVLLGDGTAPSSVYMQVPGSGWRMDAKAFREQLDNSAPMRLSMLRYTHAFFNQVAQSAACSHYHALEQRCCRWLLMTRDRMPSDEFVLTQEFLSMMLGVRRAGVSEAAGRLQRAGIITYKHGNVRIIDREALETRSCECYATSKAEFDRFLG